MKFDFELKKSLTDDELNECFEFMTSYLVEIYGEDAISRENFEIWKSNRSEKENRFFIKMLDDEKACGYAEIAIQQQKRLYFADIIIKEEFRRTTIVYDFVKYVLGLEEFAKFDEVYLHINKKNHTSYNTWKSFGLIELLQGGSSNKYKISRSGIEDFFNRSKSI